jgi:hypothetical protein
MLLGYEGIVADFTLLTGKRDLPIDHPAGTTTSMTGDEVIAHFKFFETSASGKTLISYAKHSSLADIDGELASSASVVYDSWEYFEYSSSSNQPGLLLSETALFDGVACADKHMSLGISSKSGYVTKSTGLI